MTVAAIVAAAGSGERLGAGMPKALVRLGERTLLEWSLAALADASISQVVIPAPPGAVAEIAALAPGARVVAGGVTRQDSVRIALAELPNDVDVVLVHDAARALVPVAVVQRVLAAIRDGAEAVIPVMPLADTVKQVDDGGTVVQTVDRAALRAVQTPQAFRRGVLERAHASGVTAATDDAALVEALGVPVMTVAGSAEALKVTTPIDLETAEAILMRRQAHV